MTVQHSPPENPPELAAVRPGEELPWDRLADYVVPRLAAQGLDVPPELSVRQFPNGSANLTYLLSFGEVRLVLRRPPFGRIAPGAHDMRREYRVLSRLWQRYDRAPRAFLFCDDHSVVGSDFVVSEYRSGVVIWGALPDSMRGLPTRPAGSASPPSTPSPTCTWSTRRAVAWTTWAGPRAISPARSPDGASAGKAWPPPNPTRR